MKRTVRKTRCSVGLSLAGAAIAFPFLLVIAGIFVRGVLIALADSGFDFWGLSDNVVIAMLIAIAVVLAYVPSRMIFMGLRWQVIEHHGRYCANCGYDLTGNVSGRCPECGEPRSSVCARPGE